MALTGSVSRWFNRKGYGFIHVLTSDSEHTGNDLFIHLSGINVSNDGYKSLYPGEYVSFDVDTANDGRFNCVNLTGVLGGPLLIEHPEFRYKYFSRNPQNRNNNESSDSSNSNRQYMGKIATSYEDAGGGQAGDEAVMETIQTHNDENNENDANNENDGNDENDENDPEQ